MMEFKYTDFFESEPADDFRFLQPFHPPWDIPGRIGEEIVTKLNAVGHRTEDNVYGEYVRMNLTGKGPEMTIQRSFITSDPLFIKALGIFIDSDTSLEFGALIKSNVMIGKHCEIRQSAYIRENVIAGDHCVIGHATEIKNSALIRHVECGHFNYIGDSVIGSYVNLGAGTVLSNLNFRPLSEKKENRFPPLKLVDMAGNRLTGPSKFGCIIGDGSETGCNSVIAPGTFIGKNCIIYPCVFLPKKMYSPGSIIKK